MFTCFFNCLKMENHFVRIVTWLHLVHNAWNLLGQLTKPEKLCLVNLVHYMQCAYSVCKRPVTINGAKLGATSQLVESISNKIDLLH